MERESLESAGRGVGGGRIVLCSGGGHAAAVLEVLRAVGGYEPRGIVDDNYEAGTRVHGLEVLGGEGLLEGLAGELTYAFIARGSVRAGSERRELFERVSALGFRFPVLVHPGATVAPDAELGEGTVVMPGVVLRTCARVGKNVILNSGAILDHHAQVGDHAHVATGARLAGTVTVGADSLVGAGATVLQGRTIGEAATVGGGAVVTQDVAAGALVVGVPARER